MTMPTPDFTDHSPPNDEPTQEVDSAVTEHTAIWPPPPALLLEPEPPAYNNSGERGAVPPEIARYKWNWGAFALNWIWCFSHRLPLIAIALLAVGLTRLFYEPALLIASLVLYGMQIYLGLMGHKLAWRYRHFPGGYDEFMRVQTIWNDWGIGIFVIATVVFLVKIWSFFSKGVL